MDFCLQNISKKDPPDNCLSIDYTIAWSLGQTTVYHLTDDKTFPQNSLGMKTLDGYRSIWVSARKSGALIIWERERSGALTKWTERERERRSAISVRAGARAALRKKSERQTVCEALVVYFSR